MGPLRDRVPAKYAGSHESKIVSLNAERRSAHLTRAFYNGLFRRMRIAVGRFSPSLVMPAF
jgi:hypothetical protein